MGSGLKAFEDGQPTLGNSGVEIFLSFDGPADALDVPGFPAQGGVDAVFTISKLEEITLFLISDLPNLINSPSEISSIHSFLLNSTGNFATVSFFLT